MIKKLKTKTPLRGPEVKSMILIGIALLLGIAIYNQQKAKSLPRPAVSPTPSVLPRLLPVNLTDDERFILNPPSEQASRSALDKHAQTVAKLAKIGTTVKIKDCRPDPLVLLVQQESEFKIENEDNVNHDIIFDEEHQYKIPANEATTITAKFKYGTGDYGYVCSGVGLTGFLHIIP